MMCLRIFIELLNLAKGSLFIDFVHLFGRDGEE